VVRPSDAATEVIELPPPDRRPWRVLGYAAVAVVAVAAVTLAGLGWSGRNSKPRQPADERIAVQTAELVTMDMSTTQSLAGTLGYGRARPLKGNREGIVTALPAPGKAVKRGQQLYRVDDQPVTLFYGGLPLFRTLSERNTVGRDVRVVADNLKALGYSIGRRPRAGERVAQTVPAPAAPEVESSAGPTPTHPPTPATRWVRVHRGDGVLTASLQAAIKRWQADLRLAVTGTIGPGDVVVQTGAVRVDSVAVQPGDSAAGPLMSVTPTAKVVTVPADLGEAGSVEQGDRVTVRLPDDTRTAGRVAAVGTALETPDGETGGPNAGPKLTVTITIDKPATVAKLDSADVQVDFAAETHKGVLAAPVGALLALSEGGYAVQVEGGGLVAVETGIFAKGLVEITGEGLAAGARVVTTS
jgi:peptidoglycan hydrolase-like protein with peptidoglycan-binding domain